MSRKKLIVGFSAVFLIVNALLLLRPSNEPQLRAQDSRPVVTVEGSVIDEQEVAGEEKQTEADAKQGQVSQAPGEPVAHTSAEARDAEPTEQESEVTVESGEMEPEQEQPAEPVDPWETPEKVNFKGMKVSDLVSKLSQWTGKVVIPHPDAMKEKLDVISHQELPRREVLAILYAALKEKGFVVEEQEGMLFLKPDSQAKLKSIPTVLPEQSLATIANTAQRVQRIMHIENYQPTKMMGLLQGMMDAKSGAHVFADDATRTLILVDTVANLLRYEQIVWQLDVPEADDVSIEFFQVRNGDPVEIIQMIQLLMGNELQRSNRSTNYYNYNYSRWGSGGRSRITRTDQRGSARSRGRSEQPMVLIPDPKRNMIIARASTADMEFIRDWVERLDNAEPIETEHEIVPVAFVDAQEVAEELEHSLQQMTGTEFRFNVVIRPLQQARQIMIFGSKEKREMIKKIIAEIDIPGDQFETRQFKIDHADPDTIKENIDELYELIDTSGMYGYYQMESQMATRNDPGRVRVISYPARKVVTVIASPTNMMKIAAQIEEWDVPLDLDAVRPLIVTLENSDAVQLANLLNALFSENDSSGGGNLFDLLFGGSGSEERRKIIGPLYGQLAFEAVPDTKKIIVVSKIPEAYRVIEDLIKKLDAQEVAEVPMVVELKYADAEDLCDQLNALLNEPGTMATLQRSNRGLTMRSEFSNQGNQGQSGNQNQNQDQNQNNSATTITPWWTGASRPTDEMPTSNLIGQVRFVPVHRSKAVMVLSPPEFQEQILEMIEKLDQPGKQVMVKAVIVQVNFDKLKDIGIQVSSNPGAFGALTESELLGITDLLFSEAPGSSFAVESAMNVSVVIDFLERETEGRIIEESTIWTKDNEESITFKGRSVPFVQARNTSDEGTRTQDQVEYRNVGLTLRIRPNITPESDVDLNVNLSISQLEQLLISGNIVTSNFETTTHLIVEDGQTIMISGILEQSDVSTERRLPGIHKLPLIGPLFRHNSDELSSQKLFAFVTPYVIDKVGEQDEARRYTEHVLEEMGKMRRAVDEKLLEIEEAG